MFEQLGTLGPDLERKQKLLLAAVDREDGVASRAVLASFTEGLAGRTGMAPERVATLMMATLLHEMTKDAARDGQLTNHKAYLHEQLSALPQAQRTAVQTQMALLAGREIGSLPADVWDATLIQADGDEELLAVLRDIRRNAD